MPLVFERAFRVRHYECDPYGHVNHVNYLRYMQQAAMDASEAAGYDVARYQAMGRLWFVRETDIEYLHPLVYGDTVIVKTWVLDFRRVRSRRAYELRRASDGLLVAQATTDWVFLDSRTERPVTVPPEMIAAFVPEGLSGEGDRREPFPPAPTPPPDVFTTTVRVAWHDLDAAGHVNNANYMVYLEECGIQVAEAYGWPPERMFAAGFGIVARRYRIEYYQSARYGDELTLATWYSHPRRTSATRHYTITRTRDGALIARASVIWVWIDLATGQPMRIPPDFAADFAANRALEDL